MNSDCVTVPLDVPGVTLCGNGEHLLLRFDQPWRAVASTIVGGGIGPVSALLSLHVEHNFDCADPAALLRAWARSLGLGGRFAGFLTAVQLHRAALLHCPEPRVVVLVTAGVSNGTTPGRSPVAAATPGTINIVALVDGRLPPAALVGAVKTVTEAKTLALLEAGVLTPQGAPATGTSTDAVAIVATGSGPRHPYAGAATALGFALGRLTTEAVRLGLAGGNWQALAIGPLAARHAQGVEGVGLPGALPLPSERDDTATERQEHRR